MQIASAEIAAWVGGFLWPLTRVAALASVAPAGAAQHLQCCAGERVWQLGDGGHQGGIDVGFELVQVKLLRRIEGDSVPPEKILIPFSCKVLLSSAALSSRV